MSLTNFPNGILATPNIGGDGYAGWWGNDIWYVDDTDGSDSHSGSQPTEGKATIQAAVDIAGPNDTIYLRPRDMGGDIVYPGYSAHGYYTGNIITKTTQQGLSIIGTGSGNGSIGQKVQCMIEPTASSTAATISVRAPGVNIENVGVKQIDESAGNAGGAINATSTYNTVQAWGLTVSNCFFKDFQAAGSGIGTITLNTAHWATIQHCYFRESDMAIRIQSIEALVKAPTIKDCTFSGAAADVDCCIKMGDVKNLLIDECRFLMAKPTAGSLDIYILMNGTAGSGMVNNCRFAHITKTVSHIITIVGQVLLCNCRAEDEELISS